MSKVRRKPYGGVLARVMRAAGVSNLGALAQRLGISPYTVRNWDARGRVPFGWIKTSAERFGSTVDALLYEPGAPIHDAEVRAPRGPGRAVAVKREKSPSTEAGVDPELLEAVIHSVLAKAEAGKRPMTAQKIARLAVLIYEHEVVSRVANPDRTADLHRVAERYLDLVS